MSRWLIAVVGLIGIWLTSLGHCPVSAAEIEVKPAKPARGITYTNEVDLSGPWSMHVVKIDRAHPEFRFTTTLGDGEFLGMHTLSDQVRQFPRTLGQPLAAVNGDFYEKTKGYAGRPRDLQIREGEVVSHPAGHTCFWVDARGQPHLTNVYSRFRVVFSGGSALPFNLNAPRSNDTAVLYTAVIGKTTGTHGGVEYVLEKPTQGNWLPLRVGETYDARVREVSKEGNSPVTKDTLVLSIPSEMAGRLKPLLPGAALRVITETVPDLSGTEIAIGGGPALIMGGKFMSWKDWLIMRHPRSAFGYNDKYYFLVEVDGRQIDVSLGMTFQELAEYMSRLGCDYAMNFDGGGSAAMWALGELRSSPSEGRERPAPNALVVLKKTASHDPK